MGSRLKTLVAGSKTPTSSVSNGANTTLPLPAVAAPTYFELPARLSPIMTKVCMLTCQTPTPGALYGAKTTTVCSGTDTAPANLAVPATAWSIAKYSKLLEAAA